MKRFAVGSSCVLVLSGAAFADGFIALNDFSGGETVITFNSTEMGSLGSPTADIGEGVLVTNNGGGSGSTGWRSNTDWGTFFDNIPGASLGRALADSWGASDLLFDFTGAGSPNRVGMLLSTGTRTDYDIEIRDPGGNVIATGVASMPNGSEAVFVGYEAAGGIGFIRVSDIENGQIALIDDVRFEFAGGYRLGVEGVCPGTVTVSWSGATPNVQQAIVFGANAGSTTIPGGPCAGTVLGMQGGIQLVRMLGTGSGSGSVNGNAGTAACGHFLQLVEAGSCNTSNVRQIP